jgi:hypothetical protein
MVDVTPITPPNLNPEPPPKKSERTVDKDAFHKEMHRRVEKVSETDPEHKKKRKRQEEAEEEDEVQPTQGPTTPAGHVTPFSLTQEGKKVNPLDMQKGSAISPLASAQSTAPSDGTPPSGQAPLMGAAPSADEMEDDSGFFEETAFIETTDEEEPVPTGYSSAPAPEDVLYSPPEESPPLAPLPQGQPAPPQQKVQESPPPDQSTPPTVSNKKKSSTSKKSAAPPTTPAPTKESKKPKEAAPKLEPTQGMTAEEIEQQQQVLESGKVSPEETGGFFEQFLDEKDKGLKKESTATTTGEKEGEAAVPLIAPLPPSDYIEKEKKEEEEIAATSGIGAGSPGMELPAPMPESAPVGVNNPYTNLHPEVMDLFDKMVGTMTVMSYSGIKETEVTLNTPKFASSVFFGSQIIIQEYSSAPHSFNIQLNGSPEALALFEGHADELMAAFQYGNYNFRVNRLEAGLVGQKPIIKRKGPASRNKEDERYP